MSEIMQRLGEYRVLRDRIDTAADEVKALNAELAILEKEVIDLMEFEDMKSVTLEDGARITKVDVKYPAFADKEAALNWLRDMGVYEDMATINTNTFKSYILHRLEDGLEIPECIRIEYMNRLQLRR